MMKGRILLISMAVVAGCVVGRIWIRLHSVTLPVPQAPPTAVQEAAPPAPAPKHVVDASSPPAVNQLPEPGPPVEPPRAQPPPQITRAAAQPPPPPPTQSSARPGRELQDPLARVALAFVGEDPEAEEYWLAAIFDPRLPNGEEREDLMEDLNEEGFEDPHHPGPDDIPLIVSRLEIIEEVAPYAYDDDFMIEHLGEAYKDLVNMYVQASQ